MFQRAVAIGALLACMLAKAALPAQTDSPEELLTAAQQLYLKEGPQAALPEFQRVLALFRTAGDRRGEAITLGYIGNCHKRFGDFPKALDYLNRALAMKHELGDRLEEGKTLSHLGLVYWEMGEYPEAIERLTRSIAIACEIGDRKLEGASLNNLSLVYDEQGDYRRSLEQYQRVLQLYRGTGFARGECDTLGNIGGVYFLLGQFREAMRYYQQSLAISERLGLKPSMSQDLGNLARCQLGLGQISEASSSFDRAWRLARQAGLAKEEADWLAGKGTALIRRGQYDPALKYFSQALKTYEQAGLKRELTEALNDMGGLYSVLGDAGSAEQSFRRAIAQARGIGHPAGVITNLIALGDLEWQRKRYEEAAALYTQALALAREIDDRVLVAQSLTQLSLTHRDQERFAEAFEEARQALEIARGIEARVLEAQALYAQGEIERAQNRLEGALQFYAAGEEVARTLGDPELGWRLAYGQGLTLEALDRDADAVGALERAVTTIEAVRSQLREERFRAGYSENKYQVYVALVRLLLKMGRTSDAFFVAEKLHARSYLDLLNRGLPPTEGESRHQALVELQERVRQLQRDVETEVARPRREQRNQALQVFSAELATAEREYQNLLDDLRQTEPAFAAALGVPSTEQVQRNLGADSALLEYVVAEDGVAVFLVTHSKVQAKTVSLPHRSLFDKVELLRDLLLRKGSDDWRAPAESLASFLIEPLEGEGWLAGTKLLYLVPHGILHYLPFGALPRVQTADGRFLVEDYVLAYLPSATVLVYGKTSEGDPEGSLLALAPARTRLRFAQQEARQVAKFFPPQPKVLIGRAATEASFKSEADRHRVIHVATHGYFNKLNPLLSGLELEPSRREDGRLEVHEILGLRLNADLVTLSACETAMGSGYFAEVPAGDDFVGLTRAFLFAGSPSVLATLWEVDDRSTLQLMKSFYRQLGQTDKAQALAEAQRSMLGPGGPYRHPYFWAPFVLVGEVK
ncbi:MAG TPA: CHAT domain-containing protein [Terriglobia bacterium]|nr:CHAT domain-containing protein [Terriglobia bacterium]